MQILPYINMNLPIIIVSAGTIRLSKSIGDRDSMIVPIKAKLDILNTK